MIVRACVQCSIIICQTNACEPSTQTHTHIPRHSCTKSYIDFSSTSQIVFSCVYDFCLYLYWSLSVVVVYVPLWRWQNAWNSNENTKIKKAAKKKKKLIKQQQFESIESKSENRLPTTCLINKIIHNKSVLHLFWIFQIE